MGEASNFILTPMLSEAINQIIKWSPKNIQNYCKFITEESINELKDLGFFIEDEA